MTLLSAHVALFVVVRFSAAFAVALAFAFAFALCDPRPLDLSLSEVVRDPRLVRVQVGLDDRPQLVVLESSLADGLALSVAPHAAPHCFFTSSSSFDGERFSQTPTWCSHDFQVSSNLADCRSSPAVARLAAASRTSDPLFSARSRPPSVSMPRTRSCSALFAPASSFVQWSVSPTRRTVCDSKFGWSLQVLLLLLEGSPQVEILRSAGAPRTSHPPKVSNLERNSSQVLSSLSYWTGFAASFGTSAMFVVVISQLRYHAQVLLAL